MATRDHWIVTADERQAHLYSCRKVAGRQWHLDRKRSLESRWEHYHEEHRPSALGRGPTANAAQHFASIGHEPEEEHLRFARDVVEWLPRAMEEFGIDHIRLFAASRFLGLLRKELGALGAQVELHESELTRLQAHELATHAAIIQALEPHIATR